MKKYRVILKVVYPTTVEADSEEEAIELAMDECPYDNVDEVEPIVKEIENSEKIDYKYYNGDYCPRNLIGYQFKWVRCPYTDEVGFCISVDALSMSLEVIFPTRKIFVSYKHLICIDEYNKKYKKQVNQVTALPLI